MPRLLIPILLLPFILSACSDSSDRTTRPPDTGTTPTLTYSAQIRRTEYGIPHIEADDWGSLGYGFGYAYAQDNFCVVMREVVFATGRSAELMGEEQGNVETDFMMRFLNGSNEEFREKYFDLLPDYAQDLVVGYVDGLHRYLEETGVENLPEGDNGCRNADWVYAFDEIDLLIFMRRISLGGSSDQGTFRNGILAAAGPDSAVQAKASGGISVKARLPSLDESSDGLRRMARQMRNFDRGSNALAFGSSATQNGGGLLLGNPHQPWFGAGAWYEAHLTIPGVYDVAGVSLHGYPMIGIGFNRDLAWTHTVSFANRFSFYELHLNPDNPLQYDYSGEWRDISEQAVDIQVKLADGSLENRSHTFYISQYGPIISLAALEPLLSGWPMLNGSIMAFKDANLDTGARGIQQWVEKGQASDLDGYVDALKTIGNPVFHDLAADRNGEAFYGEISAIPFITQSQIDTCINGVISPLLAQLTSNFILALDGSNPDCQWGDSPDAPPGSNLYSSKDLPQIRTTDYVGNSNGSYWLSDADNPLEGFPSVMGPVSHEGLQQFLRTRIGHLMVSERKTATDELSPTPLFNLQTLKDMMYSNRVYGAEIVLDDVLEICAAVETDPVREACTVLSNWDRHVNLDSRGAQVFTEFWRYIRSQLENPFQNIVESDEFWAEDYNPNDPLNTPAGIDTSVTANHTLVIDALVEATNRLADANVALDAPWGEVQYLQRNSENVPIHGGKDNMGVYGAIKVDLKDGGYINPHGGNSYIQVVTWDESECPIADVILVPSQSTDPESPHFADQTKLYSAKEWLRFPFCEGDIAANQIGDTLILEE